MLHNQCLVKSQTYIESIKDEVKYKPYRQGYHFMAPVGWINDPNGLSYYNGEYHLFYQHNPYSGEWSSMHWGHAVSKDLVNWRHMPIALAPSESYDNDEKGGCFSGSAVDDNGVLTLMYTGTVNKDEKSIQTQCIARSNDGINFKKYENNPVIETFPEEGSADFRDPKVWREKNSWYVVIGSGQDGHGKVLLYKSDNLLEWNYVGVMAESNGKFGYMWECPDFFKLGDKYVLMFSPMGLENRKVVYQVGEMDVESGNFTYENEGEIDLGCDYYAPQSLLDDKGRRIIIGCQNSWPWMSWFNGYGPTIEDKWNGCMSIPREIRLTSDNKLQFIPVEELEVLRDSCITYENITYGLENLCLEVGNGIHYELNVDIDLYKTTAKEFGFELRKSDKKATKIMFNITDKKITFDRNNSDDYSKGIKTCDLELDSNILSIKILSDTSSLEIYTNNYKTVLTSNIYPSENENKIEMIATDGEVYISTFKGYSLNTVNQEEKICTM